MEAEMEDMASAGGSVRRAARKDASQQAIVDALRKAGCRVEIIGEPVDLLVQCPAVFVKGYVRLWQPVEVKTPTATGKRRKRKDQEAQDAFIADTHTPVVLTPEDALRALGLTV